MIGTEVLLTLLRTFLFRLNYNSLSKNISNFPFLEVTSYCLYSDLGTGSSIRPRAHSVRGIADLTAFIRCFFYLLNYWDSGLESASVFRSFQRDIQFSQEGFWFWILCCSGISGTLCFLGEICFRGVLYFQSNLSYLFLSFLYFTKVWYDVLYICLCSNTLTKL